MGFILLRRHKEGVEVKSTGVTRRASFPATGTLLLAATDDAPVRSEIGNDSNLRSYRG